mmetsp:Transcript_11225/g.22962  ORF Transcript_11225/g.22962 Transcript_11225/m.22962 type:complete len:926 (-) Transcript_11225:42-2819(-)
MMLGCSSPCSPAFVSASKQWKTMSIYEDSKAFSEYSSAAVELCDKGGGSAAVHLDDKGCCSVVRQVRDPIQHFWKRNLLYRIPVTKDSAASGNGGDPQVTLGSNQHQFPKKRPLSPSRGIRAPLNPRPPVQELAGSILLRVPSPSGRRVAIFRKREHVARNHGVHSESDLSFCVLEIWSDYGQRIERRFLVPPPRGNNQPSWNPEERVIVYSSWSTFSQTTQVDESLANQRHQSASPPVDSSSVMSSFIFGFGRQSPRGSEKKIKSTAKRAASTRNKASTDDVHMYLVNVDTTRFERVQNVPKQLCMLGEAIFEPIQGETVVYVARNATIVSKRNKLPLSKLYASPVSELMQRIGQPREIASCNSTDNPNSDEHDCTADSVAPLLPPLSSSNSNNDIRCICLTPNSRFASCPRFAPCDEDNDHRTRLVFLSSCLDSILSSATSSTQKCCLDLDCMEWIGGEPLLDSHETIVPFFQGLFLLRQHRNQRQQQFSYQDKEQSHLLVDDELQEQEIPRYCFLSSQFMVATYQWGSCLRVVRISLETRAITPTIHHGGSDDDNTECNSVLCVDQKQGVVGITSAPNKIPVLWHVPTSQFLQDVMAGEQKASGVRQNACVLVLSQKTIFDTIMGPVISKDHASPLPGLPIFDPSPRPQSTFPSSRRLFRLDFHVEIRFVQDGKRTSGSEAPVQIVLLLPKTRTSDEDGKIQLPPLIVVPHGDSDSVSSCTSYQPSFAYLCGYCGYAVAMVDKVENFEVGDLVAATLDLKTSGLVDAQRIGILGGGERGGFLAAHCLGQYPHLFQAAVMNNPVTDLVCLDKTDDAHLSKFVNELNGGRVSGSSNLHEEEIETLLWSKSPIRRVSNVKTPTLISLGMQDPQSSQGLSWYHELRVNRTAPTKLVMYQDDDHTQQGTTAEADHWISIKRWLDDRL